MRKVIVTGTSSGIGKATALKLLAENYKIIGLARTHNIKHINYIPIFQDLASLDNLSKCIEKILIKNKNIVALVSNAGEGVFENLENLSDKLIENYYKLNLLSHMIITKKIIPYFKKNKKGYLVFIGSEAALNGGAKATLYSSAKHGLFGFVKSLRIECNKNKIRVSIINTGMVRTNFFKKLNFKPGNRKENAIRVEDIASLINYLLSTNENINISDISIFPMKKVIDFKKIKN